jgi:hypothetical protein
VLNWVSLYKHHKVTGPLSEAEGFSLLWPFEVYIYNIRVDCNAVSFSEFQGCNIFISPHFRKAELRNMELHNL